MSFSGTLLSVSLLPYCQVNYKILHILTKPHLTDLTPNVTVSLFMGNIRTSPMLLPKLHFDTVTTKSPPLPAIDPVVRIVEHRSVSVTYIVICDSSCWILTCVCVCLLLHGIKELKPNLYHRTQHGQPHKKGSGHMTQWKKGHACKI